MSYFLKSGSTYRVATKESMDLHEKLPAGNYIINEDAFGNLFLEQVASFTMPKKTYGDLKTNSDRIIRTFESRDVSTGVMLNGEKGSGKTLLSKNISITLAKQGVPTLIINKAWHGDKFNKFLQDIHQPCVVLFDEFEKVYDKDEQEEILTLLDGVFGSKKLYILTCNDKWRVDFHMRNRPGRIYYMIDFTGLSIEFIEEYCQDNLKSKEHIPTICSITALFSEFNFDMLKALVEEMNRYDESPQDALRLLNAKPEYSNDSKYNVVLVVDGQQVDDRLVNPKVFKGNPLNNRTIEIGYHHVVKSRKRGEDDDHEYREATFGSKSLVKVDAQTGQFVFQDKGSVLTLTKVKEEVFSYRDMAF